MKLSMTGQEKGDHMGKFECIFDVTLVTLLLSFLEIIFIIILKLNFYNFVFFFIYREWVKNKNRNREEWDREITTGDNRVTIPPSRLWPRGI
jgi:hypothetical protein